jgi:hypothetical protein
MKLRRGLEVSVLVIGDVGWGIVLIVVDVGWLSSKFVDVEGGKVLFEQGPRSLRTGTPRGLNTCALVCLQTLSCFNHQKLIF